jgi:prolyl-tRNA synthetase
MLDVYADFAVNDAAIPVIPGRKSNIEKFAGAVSSYTIEAMMGDGKALQSGTSHNLGQNFSRAFDTKFLTTDGSHEYVWQTSWGVSTRMVGGVIMTHGDDKGLVLPPKLAPDQVIIVPIWKSDDQKASVLEMVEKVERSLREAGIRVRADRSEHDNPGWKFNEYEMRGVPLRIEIGPKDVEKNAVVLARRDKPGKEGKEFGVPVDAAAATASEWLDDVQSSLLARATAFRDERIVDVESMDEFKSVIGDGKWARCWWAGSDDDERKIKDDTMATIRCFPIDQPGGSGRCLATGEKADEIALFAKAY